MHRFEISNTRTGDRRRGIEHGLDLRFGDRVAAPGGRFAGAELVAARVPARARRGLCQGVPHSGGAAILPRSRAVRA